MALCHDTVSTIVQYPLQRAHMIQNIHIDIQIPPCLKGMFLGTFHTEPQGIGCREWLGFPVQFCDASSCFTDLFLSVPECGVEGANVVRPFQKDNFIRSISILSLIFSFGTTRFILGQFRHLESHGPID